MRRRPVIRLLHMLWAAVFLLNSAGEATVAHGNAHHGDSHEASAVMEMAADAGHSAGHHDAGHAAEHPANAPAEQQVPTGHADQCTCAFFCGASAGLALSVEGPTAVIDEFDTEPSTTILPARTPPLRRPIPHFIAYPNGPPALI